MKSYRKELWFNVPTRRAFINITPQVEECLRESGVNEGLVLVNAMHITASVFINDDESGLHQDYETWLEQLAPHEPVSQYHHNKTGEDNADAHIKRQVMGREVVVAITKGQLDFGPWEQIFYGEFDGGRPKRALVAGIGVESSGGGGGGGNLGRDAFGEGHEGGFEIELVFFEKLQLEPGLDQERCELAVVAGVGFERDDQRRA